MLIIQEKIVGQPLGTVMQDRIWKKVGMPDTTFDLAEKNRQRSVFLGTKN